MEGVGRQNWARGRIPIFRKIRLYGKSAKSTHGHTKKKPTQPFFRDLAFFRLPRPARHRRGYPTATLQPPPYITYIDAGRIGYPMPASYTGPSHVAFDAFYGVLPATLGPPELLVAVRRLESHRLLLYMYIPIHVVNLTQPSLPFFIFQVHDQNHSFPSFHIKT
jgi:hypothetical protein